MNEPIQEKAPKPPGLLPKHVQSWLILGLAVLMVVIMWLTGGKKQQTAARNNVPAVQTPTPLEVNETKIAELQTRIQELQRQQLAAQSALAQQSRLLGAVPPDSQQSPPNYALNNSGAERAEDPIKAERKKREYLSLFASNIALSYRKNAAGTQPTAFEQSSQNSESPSTTSLPSGPDLAQIAQLLKDAQAGVSLHPLSANQSSPVPAAQTHTASASAAEANHEAKEVASPAAALQKSSDAAAGKTYILFEGSIFESVLINRL